MKVHLGAFDQPADGWYNTDITPHIAVARVPGLARLLYTAGLMKRERYDQHRRRVFRRLHYLDIRKRFPFPDDSVEAYFSSHVLEHIHIFETRHVLREMHRTLRPGGFARIVLPDLEKTMTHYRPDQPEEFLRRMFENDTPGLAKNQHKWMFTPAYFERLLREAGFANVSRHACGETGYGPFQGLDLRPEESFYIETRK